MNTENFIECVKKYPILYNRRHKDYKNASKKAEIWDIIAREMNETSDVLRTKWKGLKDGYTKYKKQTNGNTGYAKAYNNWCWGPHLQFLDNFMKQRKSTSNIRTTSQENSFLYCSVSDLSLPPPSQAIPTTPSPLESSHNDKIAHDENDVLEQTPSTSAVPRVFTTTSRASQQTSEPSQIRCVTTKTDEDVDKILNFMRNKRTKNLDAVDHLFMSYAETFKNFSIQTQTMLKVQMAKLFADAELQELNMNQIQSPLYSVVRIDSDLTTSNHLEQHYSTPETFVTKLERP